MQVFRIAQDQYIHDLEGTGARIYGGRWNRPGVPVLYTANHLSLALLELIVHFEGRAALENNYKFISLEVDDSLIVELEKGRLPSRISGFNQQDLWATLDYYFYKKNVFALQVPSVLVPQESNILLNPLHPEMYDFRKVIIKPEPILIDERFLKQG